MHVKFLALNADFSSPNADPLHARASKRGIPLKSGYFTDRPIALSSMKTVADKHRHPAYHNKH